MGEDLKLQSHRDKAGEAMCGSDQPPAYIKGSQRERERKRERE